MSERAPSGVDSNYDGLYLELVGLLEQFVDLVGAASTIAYELLVRLPVTLRSTTLVISLLRKPDIVDIIYKQQNGSLVIVVLVVGVLPNKSSLLPGAGGQSGPQPIYQLGEGGVVQDLHHAVGGDGVQVRVAQAVLQVY